MALLGELEQSLLVPILFGVPLPSLFVNPLFFPSGELFCVLLGTFKVLFFYLDFVTATLVALGCDLCLAENGSYLYRPTITSIWMF